MNDYIQRRARKSIENTKGAHWLPQHMYVYDMEGNQIIDHTVRFEYLNEDFPKLMRLYHLPVKLPGTKNARKSPGTAAGAIIAPLTVANLTEETIEIINEIYDEDFSRFQYKKVTSPLEFG